MEYEIKHYYRVKLDLLLARQSFLKELPKDDYEEYVRKVIGRTYFIILNKIDELDGTNERLLNITRSLLKSYKGNIEKYIKVWYNHALDIRRFCAILPLRRSFNRKSN